MLTDNYLYLFLTACEFGFFLAYSCHFSHRAAQKLNLSSKKKKHRPSASSAPESPLFSTSFSSILQTSPPPAPPCLLRAVSKVKDTPGVGKVGLTSITKTLIFCGRRFFPCAKHQENWKSTLFLVWLYCSWSLHMHKGLTT